MSAQEASPSRDNSSLPSTSSQNASESPKKRAKKRHASTGTKASSTSKRSRVRSADSNASQIFAVVSSFVSALTAPLMVPFSAAACFLVFLLFVKYHLSQYTPLLSVSSILSSPYHILSSSPANLYCASVGWGCRSGSSATAPNQDVGRIARSVADQATQAHDIFQSISSLGNPSLMPGLHFVELWELAIAVSASSQLESKDVLGDTLKELGDMTRDVSDSLVGIHAQGVNSFSWTVREFMRIQSTINKMQHSQYTSQDVARQLDDLFSRLGRNLDAVLSSIQSALPLANRASHLGGQVLFDLSQEHLRLVQHKEETPLWKSLLDTSRFKGRQLQRDLDLAEVSINGLKSARSQLEETRVFLLRYRENVACKSVFVYQAGAHNTQGVGGRLQSRRGRLPSGRSPAHTRRRSGSPSRSDPRVQSSSRRGQATAAAFQACTAPHRILICIECH